MLDYFLIHQKAVSLNPKFKTILLLLNREAIAFTSTYLYKACHASAQVALDFF